MNAFATVTMSKKCNGEEGVSSDIIRSLSGQYKSNRNLVECSYIEYIADGLPLSPVMSQFCSPGLPP